MLDGADENPQLEEHPRHLRSRRGRHAAHPRVAPPEPDRYAERRARLLVTGRARLHALTAALRGPAADPALLPDTLLSDRSPLRSFLPAGARRATALAAAAAVAVLALSTTLPDPQPATTTVAGADLGFATDPGRTEAAQDQSRASRSGRSQPGPAKGTQPKDAQPKDAQPKTAQPSAATSSAPAPAPTKPAPVGGLSQTEMDNAVAIVDVAKRENLPKRAAVVALATALQESHLRNLANGNLPQSLDHPNQGVGYDYDSVGLFQQRPNWGSIDQLMDPHESARRFYAALVRIPGWGDYAVSVAAQMVQVSAFPDAYAKWEGLATQIADATM